MLMVLPCINLAHLKLSHGDAAFASAMMGVLAKVDEVCIMAMG